LLTGKVERLESELKEKSERIEDLEAQVGQLRTELATVRSERDRLVAALEEREFYQEMNDEQRTEEVDKRSSIEKVRQFVSFDR
jgi:putative DNA primase/helicase